MKRPTATLEVDRPFNCRIRTQGNVSKSLAGSWEGLRIHATARDGYSECIFSGQLPDQSALIGVINYLYDLGMSIVSVECTTAAADGDLASGP